MDGSGHTTERPFTLDEIIGILDGEPEFSTDDSVVAMRNATSNGRTCTRLERAWTIGNTNEKDWRSSQGSYYW